MFNVFKIQQKVTCHTKNQGNHNMNEKGQSADTDNDINQKSKLSDRFYSIHKNNSTVILEQNKNIKSQQRNENYKIIELKYAFLK